MNLGSPDLWAEHAGLIGLIFLAMFLLLSGVIFWLLRSKDTDNESHRKERQRWESERERTWGSVDAIGDKFDKLEARLNDHLE